MSSKECYVVTRKIVGGDSYPIRVFLSYEEAIAYKQSLVSPDSCYTVYMVTKVSLVE